MARRTGLTLPATTLIKNAWSAGGVSTVISISPIACNVTSGALSANELATVLSVTGGGYCQLLAAYNNSAVPTHTIRCVVTVDGVVVFDATSDTISSTVNKRALIVTGDPEGGTYLWEGFPIRFNSSLLVQIASSQAGTDYVALAYEYQKT